MKTKIIFGITLAYCLAACSGNDDVEMFSPWTEEYELPQGLSDADDRIEEYYKRYGTYILYNYTDEDFYYELGGMNVVHKLPDPMYVGDMLDLLEDIWFDFYPEDFHKKYMPLKIMLADYIASVDSYTGTIYPMFLLSGSSCQGFGFCSDTLKKLSPATKLEFKSTLHMALWQRWVEQMEFPEEFFSVSDYSHATVLDPSSEDYARNRGFVAYIGYDWSLYPDGLTGQLDKKMDVTSFLMNMIVRTSMQWKDDLQWPLVKQKYDILRNFLQDTYGFDIQKVGDATYE